MTDDEFFERAKREMFPKMKESALSVVIASNDPDPKLCLEIGAAILFDKPIIVVVSDDRLASATLRRIATVVVEGDLQDPATADRLNGAIDRVLQDEARKVQ